MEPKQKLPPLPPPAEKRLSMKPEFFVGWPCYLCHLPYLTRYWAKRLKFDHEFIAKRTNSDTFIEFHCQLPEHKRVYHSLIVESTSKCQLCEYSPSV